MRGDPVVNEYSPEQIKKLRVKNNASQTVFAAYLNASTSTDTTMGKWSNNPKRPITEVVKLGRKKRS